MKKFAMLSALCVVFAGGGCGTGSEAEVDDPSAGKADDPVARPVGAYDLSQESKLGFGDLQLFVVKTDKTFHAEKTEQGGSDLLDGKLTYTKSGTKRFINLKDSAGSVLAKYEFKMDSGALSLKDARVKSASWFVMAYLESPWCKDSAPDCDNQGYSGGDCDGEWACNAGACKFNCGTNCDDGGQLICALRKPTCPKGTVAAVQKACYTCADVNTCKGLGIPRNCDDGSEKTCADDQPTCADLDKPALIEGCWKCVNTFTCQAG